MITATRITGRAISAKKLAASIAAPSKPFFPALFKFDSKLLALPAALQAMNATFTRASTATVVQNGAIVSLASGQFGTTYDSVTGMYGYVSEPAATNLCTYSDGAASTYTVSNVVDGTTVTGFTNGLAFGDNSLQRSATKAISVTNATVYSISFFVIMDDGLAPVVGTTNTTGDFSLALNAVIATTKLERVIGSSVYRVSASITAAATSSQPVGIIKYVGQSARTFRATGFQLETGVRATSYIPTVAATATRAANVLSVPLWVNRLTYSQDLSNAAWTKENCNVATGVADPFGGTAAQTLTSTAPNGRAYQFFPAFTTQNVHSMWIRRRTGTGLVESFSGSGYVPITVTTEWTRIQAPSFVAPPSSYAMIRLAVSGDAVDVYGVQLEAGSIATAYRPTTSTLESVANANIPGFTAAQYTLFAEYRDEVLAQGADRYIIQVDDNFSANRAFIRATSSGGRELTTISGNVAQSSYVTAGSTSLCKVCASSSANNFLGAINGSSVTADLSGAMPVAPTVLRIGNTHASAQQFNGFIFRAGLITRALTQEQINGLTL